MKKLVYICAVVVVLASTSVFGSVDLGTLTSSPYEFDSRAGTSADVTKISFDYSYGNYTLPVGQAAFRIRRLNDDNSDSWLGSFNIFNGSYNLDTDYGPYSTTGNLTGSHHYEFTLNRSNGLWDLAIDNVTIAFSALVSTNNPQPDGVTVLIDGVIANKYFSDESAEAHQNAIDLGWTDNAGDGVGGTGAYRLEFTGLTGATGAYVDNISIVAVPVPGAILLGGLGAGLVGWMKRRKICKK